MVAPTDQRVIVGDIKNGVGGASRYAVQISLGVCPPLKLGYGEREIPKPRTYRNIWVVTGDARHLSLKEPYGAVLTL